MTQRQLAMELDMPTCSHCGQVARAQTCQACRSGQHVDHHGGVWDYANPDLEPDPVVCLCPRCVTGRRPIDRVTPDPAFL